MNHPRPVLAGALLAVLWLAATGAPAAFAGNEDEAATATARLRFGPPDLYKIGPQSAFLKAADLNGDGRTDLVCADNSKNLFYFLFQQEGQERRFKLVEEPAETVVGSLAVGDFNGDGRTDLAIGGTQSFVRYQNENGVLGDPRELPEHGREALAADVDGDAKQDLLLLEPEEMILLRQTAAGKFADPVRRRHAYKAAGAPLCFDVNGDNRPDLAYRDAQAADILVLRLQNETGLFDPEIGLKAGFNFYLAGASQLGAKGGGFAAAEDKTRVLKVLRLEPDKAADDPKAVFSLMRMVPYSDEKTSGKSRLTVADVDGNGAPEIVVLCEDRPAFDLLHCAPAGAITRETIPALLGGRKLRVAPDGAQQGAFWLLSLKEQTIGASRLSGGKIGFPQPLELGAQPQAFDLADVDGSGQCDLIFVANVEKRARLIILHDPSPTSLENVKRTEIDLSSTGLEAFKNLEAEDLIAADLNRDGRTDIVLFPKYGALQILLQTEDGQFKPYIASAVTKGLFEGVAPEQFVVGDILKDGRNEILVAKSSFARLLAMESSGTLTVVEQLNGKSGASKIASVAAGDLAGDGSAQVALLDKGERVVTVYRRGDDGAFSVLKHINIDPVAGTDLHVADLNGDGRDDLAIGASDSFAVIFAGRPDPVLRSVATQRTEVKDGGYRLVAVGDLAPGGGEEIVALENKERLLEFYQLEEGDALRRLYKFKVFGGEGAHGFYDPSQARPPEPREIIFPDLNGDGMADLAALVHDHVIAYLQEPADRALELASCGPSEPQIKN